MTQDTEDHTNGEGFDYPHFFESSMVDMALDQTDPSTRMKTIITGRIGRVVLEAFEDLVTDGHVDPSEAIASLLRMMVTSVAALGHAVAKDDLKGEFIAHCGTAFKDMADDLVNHLDKAPKEEIVA